MDASLGLIFATAFAMNGERVDNVVTFPKSGLIQLLCPGFPEDGEVQEELFRKIKADMVEVIIETGVKAWLSYPEFTLKKTHPLIVSITADATEGARIILTAALNNYDIIESVDVVQFYPSNNTFYMKISTKMSQLDIAPFVTWYIRSFMVVIFNYPSDSYVNVTTTQIDNVLYISIQIYEWDCSFPGPFYGACCIGKSWFSTGNALLQYEDLIATIIQHDGTMTVLEQLNILDGSLIMNQNFTIMNTLLLVINSTVSVGQTIQLVATTMEISSGSTISGSTILIQNDSQLVIQLNETEVDLYKEKGYITVSSIFSQNIQGNFSSISFQDYNSSGITGCSHVVTTPNGCLITLHDCNSTPETLIMVIVIVVVVLFLASLIGLAYFIIRMRYLKERLDELDTTAVTSSISNSSTSASQPDFH
eukprot:TRINITY_DN152_c0_g1_i2.p1 TRINITY_DN152_c0_g1~~TRINITY_DN152_c0_g1_i2.p1  ORF type:complete len:421 (+),score=100.52 TRINITY_DN152_c0_g1_i2:2191-3453(+)